MKRIGIRELRQNASVWIREAQHGETIEITDRGRPVARLVPVPSGDVLERLIAEGRIRPAAGDLLDLGPPLPLQPGMPTRSEVLEQMRADER